MDALRDLDDPLTLVHLFATLPAEKKYEIPTEASCSRLQCVVLIVTKHINAACNDNFHVIISASK